MAECKPLVEAIREGGEKKRWAMEEIYRDKRFHQTAWKNYQRCSAVRSVLDWNDFFIEAVLRFVVAVSRGGNVQSCRNYFFGICRNYCYEQTRKLREPDPIPDADLPIDDLVARLRPFVDRLRKQSRLLLYMIYFQDDPIDRKDYPRLVSELRKHGYDPKESSISAMVTNSLAELRKAVGDKLDDYLSA